MKLSATQNTATAKLAYELKDVLGHTAGKSLAREDEQEIEEAAEKLVIASTITIIEGEAMRTLHTLCRNNKSQNGWIEVKDIVCKLIGKGPRTLQRLEKAAKDEASKERAANGVLTACGINLKTPEADRLRQMINTSQSTARTSAPVASDPISDQLRRQILAKTHRP